MYRFSKNIMNTPKSYIREILKLIGAPGVISFGGGLPNKAFFPVEAVKNATCKVLDGHGVDALQYSTTEGYLPLRKWIADRYKQKGLEVNPDEILIVNGSQQAIDLVGRVFLEEGDDVLLEEPGYLGAIQAFSQFMPNFHHVELAADGINTEELELNVKKYNPKIFYAVPNFQNPTGLTYSLEKRKKTAEIINNSNTVLLEDDPYGELRFIGEALPPINTFVKENRIILGSFSKIVAPGMRMGWVCAPKAIMDKLVTAKQAADLHSNYFSQMLLAQYLADNDINKHISKIKAGYYSQRAAMVNAIKKYFPENIKFTEPEGGMFLWVTLPEGFSALELADYAFKNKVGFVPGEPFYADGRKSNAMRLNYTASDEATIEEGVRRLAKAIEEYISGK